jgi:hypothetical protein
MSGKARTRDFVGILVGKKVLKDELRIAINDYGF